MVSPALAGRLDLFKILALILLMVFSLLYGAYPQKSSPGEALARRGPDPLSGGSGQNGTPGAVGRVARCKGELTHTHLGR